MNNLWVFIISNAFIRVSFAFIQETNAFIRESYAPQGKLIKTPNINIIYPQTQLFL